MKKIFVVVVVVVAIVFASCTTTNHNEMSCRIVTPEDGFAVMPQDSFVISINADGVSRVRLYIDSIGYAEFDRFPYNLEIKSFSQKVGRHIVVAVADDGKGNIVSDTSCFYIGIGVEYGGGIIFDLDSTGQHGLIAAKEDLPGTYAWKTSGVLIGALDPDHGEVNTRMVVESELPSDAVAACAKYSAMVNGTKYDGWYMPATNELVKMYENLYLNHIGNFGAKYYWTSTEMGKYDSYTVFFYDGLVIRKNKYVSCSVRPIKAF